MKRNIRMKTKPFVLAGAALLATLAVWALAHSAVAAENYKAYAACSQHPGGGWCSHHADYEAAKRAAEAHNKATGHSASASSGKCPLN